MKTTVLTPFPKALDDSKSGPVTGGKLTVCAEASVGALLRDEREVGVSDSMSQRKDREEEGADLPELKGETKLLSQADSFKQIRENVLCAAFPY